MTKTQITRKAHLRLTRSFCNPPLANASMLTLIFKHFNQVKALIVKLLVYLSVVNADLLLNWTIYKQPHLSILTTRKQS